MLVEVALEETFVKRQEFQFSIGDADTLPHPPQLGVESEFQFSIGDAYSVYFAAPGRALNKTFQFSIGDARRAGAHNGGSRSRVGFNSLLEMPGDEVGYGIVTTTYSEFQFSIGDAHIRDARRSVSACVAVSILYWRCKKPRRGLK